jgi:hypothetical protein
MGALEYPEQYIEEVFYLWYRGGKKQGDNFVHTLPEAPDGRKPAKFTVIKWINTLGWVERADALDAETSLALDKEVINERVEMFKKQKKIAGELVTIGMEFLNGKGIQTDASAIRAIDLGLSTQRISTGMAEMYTKISTMPNETLTKELQRLLGKPISKDDETLDAEIIDEE